MFLSVFQCLCVVVGCLLWFALNCKHNESEQEEQQRTKEKEQEENTYVRIITTNTNTAHVIKTNNRNAGQR